MKYYFPSYLPLFSLNEILWKNSYCFRYFLLPIFTYFLKKSTNSAAKFPLQHAALQLYDEKCMVDFLEQYFIKYNTVNNLQK